MTSCDEPYIGDESIMRPPASKSARMTAAQESRATASLPTLNVIQLPSPMTGTASPVDGTGRVRTPGWLDPTPGHRAVPAATVANERRSLRRCRETVPGNPREFNAGIGSSTRRCSLSMCDQPACHREIASDLWCDDHHFRGVGRHASQRQYRGPVGYEHQIALAAPIGHQRTQRFDLACLVFVPAEEIAKWLGYFSDVPERQLRRFPASAPGTRERAFDGDIARPERLADFPRMPASDLGEISLRAAVVEAHSRRIACTRRRYSMSHEDDLATGFERFPDVGIRDCAVLQKTEAEQRAAHDLDDNGSHAPIRKCSYARHLRAWDLPFHRGFTLPRFTSRLG